MTTPKYYEIVTVTDKLLTHKIIVLVNNKFDIGLSYNATKYPSDDKIYYQIYYSTGKINNELWHNIILFCEGIIALFKSY